VEIHILKDGTRIFTGFWGQIISWLGPESVISDQ
jgi:hypothetical protein